MTINPKTMQITGLKVTYLEAGPDRGRALLLLHGGIGDARLHWEVAMPTLAETFHVLAPDLPGFGGSQRLPTMRTDALLNWVKAFLEQLHIEEAVVVGNSFGGLVARLFAALYPQYTPAVILVNGGAVPDIPAILSIAGRIPLLSPALFGIFGRIATTPKTLNRMLHSKDLLTETFTNNAKLAAPGFAGLMRMLVASPMPKQRAPMTPTLILWGADDQLATLADAKAIKDSIPGAVLTEITDCGHMPQLETPDVFVWQINTFLEKLSRVANTPDAGPRTLGNPPG